MLLHVFNYRKCLEDLAAPSWLVNTFRRYLDADTWALRYSLRAAH